MYVTLEDGSRTGVLTAGIGFSPIFGFPAEGEALVLANGPIPLSQLTGGSIEVGGAVGVGLETTFPLLLDEAGEIARDENGLLFRSSGATIGANIGGGAFLNYSWEFDFLNLLDIDPMEALKKFSLSLDAAAQGLIEKHYDLSEAIVSSIQNLLDSLLKPPVSPSSWTSTATGSS